MAEKFESGKLTEALARATALGVKRSDASVVKVAAVIERGYKDRLNQSSHKYGTQSPAFPGGRPPSRISGQLGRSVTHEIAKVSGSVRARIGPGETPRAPNGTASRRHAKRGRGSST